MSDGSGFSGVSQGELVDPVGVSGGDAAGEARVLAGVQMSLLPTFDEIQLWVCRLREGSGGPLFVDEALTEIESALARAVVACDGQLSAFDGVS